MRALHLGEQRDDVLGVGHEDRLAHVAAHGHVVGTLVDDGPKQVLYVRHAHDAVDVLVVDGDAREARAAHEVEHFAQGLGVLHGGHVHARHHDLARHRVAQVEYLVNHRLLLVREVVGVSDHVADLLLGDLLAVVGALDAQQLGEALGGGAREPDQGLYHAREAEEEARDRLGDGLGVGERDALGDELADDDGDVGDQDGDHRRGDGVAQALRGAE